MFRSRASIFASLALSLAVAGCVRAPGALLVRPVPAASAPSTLAALPGPSGRYVESSGGADVAGLVNFGYVTDPFFADSAATYRLLAMPAASAFVALTTLDEDLLARGGEPIRATTGADGRFNLPGAAPAGRPYVVTATLAQNHRLSAIALPGTTDVTLDEATTAVAETARWQIRDVPIADPAWPAELTVSDWTTSALDAVTALTRLVLGPQDFAAVAGEGPAIAPLQAGSGHLLRNRYVAAFGSAISADPASTATPDALSDAWQALLGFRPLAITVVAGNGTRNAVGSQGTVPTDSPLLTPVDAVSDHLGNLFLAEQDAHLIRFVPAQAMAGPFLEQLGPLVAGKLYIAAGQFNGSTTTLSAYNGIYKAGFENGGTGAPIASKFPLITPTKLVLRRVGATDDSHIFFTSMAGARVFFIPGSTNPTNGDGSPLFGRSFTKGKLYTIAGTGASANGFYGSTIVEADDPLTTFDETRKNYLLGDGGAANAANLNFPSGLAQDSRGNLYVLDAVANRGQDRAAPDALATLNEPCTDPAVPAGRYTPVYHASLRLIRALDGQIFNLRATLGGQPLSFAGASDVRIAEGPAGNWAYVALTPRHVVVRVPLPADLTTLDTGTPAPAVAEVVLGKLDKPGFVDLDVAGAYYPAVHDTADGVPESHVLLNAPVSLEFDGDGNLLVADAARVRMLEASGLSGAGQVFTLAGGFATTYLSGDARLAVLPGTTYLNREASGDVLLVDRKENIVRRLHTRRGTR